MFGSVTVDTDLAHLEGTAAEAGARVRVGAVITVASLAAFTGTVPGVVVRRQIRERKQLPAARIIER